MGVVNDTIEPIVMGMIGKEKLKLTPIHEKLARGTLPSAKVLRTKGSMNLWASARLTRMLAGEKKLKGESITHDEALCSFFTRQRLDLGHRLFEATGTGYDPIHAGIGLSCSLWGSSRLRQLALDWLIAEKTLFNAIRYQGDRFATCGTRCIVDESPTARYFFEKQKREPDPIKKAIPWLFWKHETYDLITNSSSLNSMRLAIGELHIRRYEDGSVVTYYPRMISSAVGNAKKSAHRTFAVGIAGKPLAYTTVEKIGGVMHTIENKEDNTMQTRVLDWTGRPVNLPNSNVINEIVIPREDAAWEGISDDW